MDEEDFIKAFDDVPVVQVSVVCAASKPAVPPERAEWARALTSRQEDGIHIEKLTAACNPSFWV